MKQGPKKDQVSSWHGPLENPEYQICANLHKYVLFLCHRIFVISFPFFIGKLRNNNNMTNRHFRRIKRRKRLKTLKNNIMAYNNLANQYNINTQTKHIILKS